HRREHTIEFQALFVRYLFGEETKIAPLLSSYTPLHLAPEESDEAAVEARERIQRTIDAIRTLVERRPGRVLLVASADLSHVGPRYGDRAAPSHRERDLLEASDRALIGSILSADADALSSRITATGDRTRVCGYPPVHLLLSVLGGGRGALVRYEQAVMGEEGSVVSFASIVLT
ncbi:MAG: AmmeMemoRadiSam system protein B, partial [Candidatus Eisenbacteria bacterium]